MLGSLLTLFGQAENDRAPVRANLPAHQARSLQFVDQADGGRMRQTKAEAERFVRASIIEGDDIQRRKRRTCFVGVVLGAPLSVLYDRNGNGAQEIGGS